MGLFGKKNQPDSQGWQPSYDDLERIKSTPGGVDGGISTNPFQNQHYKRSRRRTNYVLALRNAGIIGAVGLLTLGGATINSTIQKTRENTEKIEQISNPSFQTRHQAIGRQVVINYLKGGYAPISYTKDVTWGTTSPLLDTNSNSTVSTDAASTQSEADDEATTKKDAEQIQSSSKNITLTEVTFISGYQTDMYIPNGDLDRHPEMVGAKMEVLQYYAVFNGQPVYINISLASPQDINELPVLIATPTIDVPKSIESFGNLRNEPLGRNSSVSLSKESQNQVNRWSKAWAQNDTATLKQIANDDNVQARYEGIGNWNVDANSQVKVLWSYEKTYATHSGKYLVARVQFDMYQNVKVEDSEQPQRVTNKQTMDIIIANNDSGLPSIVSWGPAGTWDDLEPYSVANVSKENEKMPDNVVTEEPTASASNSSSGEGE